MFCYSAWVAALFVGLLCYSAWVTALFVGLLCFSAWVAAVFSVLFIIFCQQQSNPYYFSSKGCFVYNIALFKIVVG